MGSVYYIIKEFDDEGADSANGVDGIQAYLFGTRYYAPAGVWMSTDPLECSLEEMGNKLGVNVTPGQLAHSLIKADLVEDLTGIEKKDKDTSGPQEPSSTNQDSPR